MYYALDFLFLFLSIQMAGNRMDQHLFYYFVMFAGLKVFIFILLSSAISLYKERISLLCCLYTNLFSILVCSLYNYVIFGLSFLLPSCFVVIIKRLEKKKKQEISGSTQQNYSFKYHPKGYCSVYRKQIRNAKHVYKNSVITHIKCNRY